jgi:hypothetical protein
LVREILQERHNLVLPCSKRSEPHFVPIGTPGIQAPNCPQANIWIEGENNPAQMGRAGRQEKLRSVSIFMPGDAPTAHEVFMELVGTWDVTVRTSGDALA